jgi:serine/threonine protein kinase
MAATGALELGSIIGGYRIDELIGRGGMGEVYRTTNVALGRIYALKVLAPELAADEQFRERFRREMQIAGSLHHPNVVPIHYADDVEGMLFFVMEFIYGPDLHAVMRKSGPLEPARSIALLTQMAGALDAAHGIGLVHRDVKPENVLITVRDGEEHAYLTDFGLAKKFDVTSDLDCLTRRGAVVGTIRYMSPEQIRGGHTDARTDIYALGCIFFQMLTGHLPYECATPVATMFAHLRDPPPRLTGRLSERYPNLSAVIEKATSKDPEGRYLSVGDFARDAAAALAGKRYTSPPTVVATGEATPLPGGARDTHAGSESESEPAPRPSVPTQAGVESEAKPAWRRPVPDDQTRPHVPAIAATAAETRVTARPEESAGRSGRTVQDSPPPDRPGRRLPGGADGAVGPPTGRRQHGRYRWALVAFLICLAGGAAAAIALMSSSSSTNNNKFTGAAGGVPTNRVSGAGTATVELKGDVATVSVDTHGLVDQLHWMHIHGGTGICPTAAAAQRKNGHLFISAAIGDSVYGPPVTSLTTAGDTSAQSHLDLTRYESTGAIRYTRTISVGVPVEKEIRAGLAVIVVHGIDYNHNGVYDNSLGSGQERGAPALCAVLSPEHTATARARPSRDTVYYTASLRPYSSSSAKQLARLQWFCHGAGKRVIAPPTPPEARARGST